jgi:hypothetical protein
MVVGQAKRRAFPFLCAQFHSGCLLFFFFAAAPGFRWISLFQDHAPAARPVYKKKSPFPYIQNVGRALEIGIFSPYELCYHEGKNGKGISGGDFECTQS